MTSVIIEICIPGIFNMFMWKVEIKCLRKDIYLVRVYSLRAAVLYKIIWGHLLSLIPMEVIIRKVEHETD